jgi:hypothetical protein
MQCIKFLKNVELELLSMYIYSFLNTGLIHAEYISSKSGGFGRSWFSSRKITETSFRLAGAPTDMWTEHLPNTLYYHVTLFDRWFLLPQQGEKSWTW